MLLSCGYTNVVNVSLSYHIHHFSNVKDKSSSSALQPLIFRHHTVNLGLSSSKLDNLQPTGAANNRAAQRKQAGWPRDSMSASTNFMTSFSAGTPSQYQLIKKVKSWSMFNFSLKPCSGFTFFHCWKNYFTWDHEEMDIYR